MYINHSISYLFSSLIDKILNYPIYIFISISSITLSVLMLNKSCAVKYIVLSINIAIFINILIFYNYHLFRIDIFNHGIFNIYFYFSNSLVFITLNTIILFKDEFHKLNYIIYIISLIFILFSLFMTYYLSFNHYLIFFNIYSEIVLGNIIYIFYYLYLILLFFKK